MTISTLLMQKETIHPQLKELRILDFLNLLDLKGSYKIKC